MNRYYISRNYSGKYLARGKAKIDCEDILEQHGVKNAGLKRKTFENPVVSFLWTFFSVVLGIVKLPKGSTLIIQYPLKKYFQTLVYWAEKKNCEIVVIVHDLGSQRRKKRSGNEECNLLNRCSCVIAHNPIMKQFLIELGVKSKIVSLEIFDYLRSTEIPEETNVARKRFEIVYAGGLSVSKNSFIYDLNLLDKGNFCFKLFGVGFQEEKLKLGNNHTEYGGFFSANEVIDKVRGSFGLVWDGGSLETCSGKFGEYLKLNTPHKTSMYIQCGLPIIIWDQAAMASFVIDNKIGFTVSSLYEIKDKINEIEQDEYDLMVENTKLLRKRLSSGYYLKKAVDNSSLN